MGKCSLSVAISIISYMGMEAVALPTAVLSNHTGFKDGYTFYDMTQAGQTIVEHWIKTGVTFDTIYMGYLGRVSQIGLAHSIFDTLTSNDPLKIIDPAMADGGELYSGLDMEYAAEMTKLCRRADIVLPNLTEACIMTGTKYREDISISEQKDIAKKIARNGTPIVIITGVKKDGEKIGALIYYRNEDKFSEIYRKYIPGHFCGSGDVFASCFSAALTGGAGVEDAVRTGLEFVSESIKQTKTDPGAVDYGINFESAFPLFRIK